MVKIPTKVLLKLYLIIPFSVLVVAADMIFFSGHLRRTLRADPETYRWITIFLFYPHVLMSLGTFLDKEYLTEYKEKFLSPKLIPYAGTVLIGFFWNQEIFFILFSYLSSKHLMGQQIGLEKLLANGDKNMTRSNLSCHLYIIISTIIYYRIAFPQSIFWISLAKFDWGQEIYFLIAVLIYFVLFFEARGNFLKAKNLSLKILFWGNYFLITSAICFLQSGYIFFAFLVPRFIHDITAIFFYVCHNKNRNANSSQNFINQFVEKVFKKYPPYVLPLIYFSFSNLLIQIDLKIVEVSLFCLGVFHFYVEGFMWKRGSLHRRYVCLEE
jgi:hypothetical protein